ncbi:MAG: WYL domain-containing protein [Prevotella sp.]|nr:WYL domain-containing protein [Prevotella sp.]
MISKTYLRYIWLLDTILNLGPLTYEEIALLWEVSPYKKGGLPLRTFHEHRKGIKEMFGIIIECNKSKGYTYYVKNPEVLNNNKLGKWLLKQYSVPQDFTTYARMRDRILLEEIPHGTSYLDPIIEAMQSNVELLVDYQRYEGEQGEEHLQIFHIQPYALKVFNRRWYLLGFFKEIDGLRIIALDRILALKMLTNSFTLPEDFDARKYFANVVGIFVNKDLPITNVKIRAYGIQAEYLRSTPLHKSQSEGNSKHGEFAEFTYRLCITPELVSLLLAMGDKVEVQEPESLREEMKKRISNMFNFYNKRNYENY